MDDPRLATSYARAISRDAASLRRRAVRALRRRRDLLRALLLVLVVFALGFGYYAHLQGRFRRLKTELKTSRQPAQEPPVLVGGQEPVLLEREPLSDGAMPEFLSATLLPGRGMAVLQLTASIPGRGVVSLLDSATLEEATHALADPAVDPTGRLTAQLSSPIQAPWAGTINGTRADLKDRLLVEWRGHPVDLPLTGPLSAASSGGLLASLPSDALERNIMPDGGSVQAEFDAHDFGARWPSQTHLTVTALLSSRAFDLRVTARNTGREPEPIGIGWIPRLLLPSGSLANATLHVPADQAEEIVDGRATGRLNNVSGTPLDFTARNGRRLGTASLHTTFGHLKTGFLDNGPVLEVRDVDSGTGIRLSALSPQIRAVHITTGPRDGVLAAGFLSNYDDPFSRVWHTDQDGGLFLLAPGQTVQWRVRLELFGINSDATAPL